MQKDFADLKKQVIKKFQPSILKKLEKDISYASWSLDKTSHQYFMQQQAIYNKLVAFHSPSDISLKEFDHFDMQSFIEKARKIVPEHVSYMEKLP